MVTEGDTDEAIIADWMEQGLGFRHILAMVNQSQVERGLIHISISALIFAFRCHPGTTQTSFPKLTINNLSDTMKST